MYTFQTTVHARPAAAALGPKLQVDGHDIQTLSVAPESLSVPMGVSFEEAAAALSALPRMYCEGDGSFVWVSSAGQPDWQVDGVLYDRQQSLLFVDLKGECPEAKFDQLLRAFGWPQTPLVFQLRRQAVLLDEQEFRRWLQSKRPKKNCGGSVPRWTATVRNQRE